MALIKPIAVGGLNVTNATLNTASPVSIEAGHIAVATAFQLSQIGNPTASITVSGTEGVDYEILLNDTTTDFQSGEFHTHANHAMVVKAINNITLTLAHSGGTNYTNGGALVYDLS